MSSADGKHETAQEQALTDLVRESQQAGHYDPPGSEAMRRHINEQAKEIERLRFQLEVAKSDIAMWRHAAQTAGALIEREFL